MVFDLSLFQRADIHVTYSAIKWTEPPILPKNVEFLESQQSLYYGVLYIAESEERAVSFFKGGDLTIYDGVILIVAGASDSAPGAFSEIDALNIIGIRESAGMMFNSYQNWNNGSVFSASSLFSSVFYELIHQPLLTAPEIGQRIALFPELKYKYFRVVVIGFYGDSVAVPYWRLIKQIQSLVPGCCATLLENQIVLLVSYQDSFPFDITQISDLLNQYCGRAAVSNGSSKLNDIRLNYFLTQKALKIVTEMDLSKDCIFHAGDFGSFILTYIASKSVQEEFGDASATVLLCHPAIVRLRVYDKQNNDDLMELFYNYLNNDCNVARTANAVFLHRNTVLNKIKKIERIVDSDLNNNDLRHFLLMSCQILRYLDVFYPKNLISRS